MAEHVEEAEAGPVPGAAELPAAAALVVAAKRARGAGKSGQDAELDSFLRKQGRLVDLQMEHLHEQRELVTSRLRLGRWKDRVTLALQALTGLVGAAFAGAVAVMAWQAHADHGVSIAAFSTPPDLAQRGLTGQVIASELLDGLAALQAKTVTARPASSYANDWGGEIKVEIPETGVSIGELDRYLRDWLGSETRITGEVVRTPTGIAVTARSGEAPGKRFEGSESDLDQLVAKAAEAVYAQTQPYRYAVYLASTGRRAEASGLFARLAEAGAPEDRPWAYAGWASILQTEGRHYEAVRMARAAMALNPDIQPPYETLGVSADVVGDRGVGLENPAREMELVKTGKVPGLTGAERADRVRFLNGVQAFYRYDFRTAADLLAPLTAFDLEGRQAGYTPRHLRARVLAGMHEVTAAEQLQAGPLDMNSYQALVARGETLGDWAGAAAALDAGARDPALAGDAQTTLVPALRARALAHLGRAAEAEALAAPMPLGCYQCLITRGEIATVARDWTAADRWWAELDRRAPNLPQSAWAASLLARGDLDGAIRKAAQAHQRSPHFADPLEIWGEALLRKGDAAAAAGKFAEAAPDAPRWGRLHLMWGEALMLSGRPANARAQYAAAKGMDLAPPERAALDVLLARTAAAALRR